MSNPEEKTIDPVLEQDSIYVDLHCHSEYSSLDGGAKVKDMAAKLISLGRRSMALTDHGVMQGLPPFYSELKKAGIKPILGMEAYLTEDRFDKSRGTPTWHLTLLAETEEGYENLCKISSWAFIDGVIKTFGRPRARADWDLLSKYSKGIIAFTGCMASPVMGAIFKGDLAGAYAATEKLIDIFGADNVYGEIQDVGITIGIPADSEIAVLLGREALTEEEAARYSEVEAGEVPFSQNDANHILVDRVCKPLGIKYVATGDTHYLNEEDANPHDIMICIGTGQKKKGPRRFSLLPKKYHMRTDAEVKKAMGQWPEAIAESKKIALRCNVDGAFTHRELLPKYPLPAEFTSSADYLRHLCVAGLKERYEETSQRFAEAMERLEMELGVINSMGFNDYFLITWDLFNEANRRGILSGPGRGCLTGDVPVWTPDGMKKLQDIQYGDLVMTHSGTVSEVLNFFEYNIEEELVEIKTFYGDRDNHVKMTLDHKVLVEKGSKRDIKSSKDKVWEPSQGNPQWIEAGKIEVGDYVVVPRQNIEVEDVQKIDLAGFAQDDERYVITENEILETRITNKPYRHSVRELARVHGFSRSSLRRISDGVAGSALLEKVIPVLNTAGFSNAEEWVKYCNENQTTTIVHPRFITVDEDLLYLLGRFVADGWVRKSGARGGYADHSVSPKGKDIAKQFEKVFGYKLIAAHHAKSQLVQYTWNSNLLTDFFTNQVPDYEYTAQTKQLPKWVFSLPENKRQALIDGLWAGDGSFKGKTTYTTCSDILADQIRTLLWGLGIPAGIHKDKRSAKDTRPGFENSTVANVIVASNGFKTPLDAYGAVDKDYIYLRVREVNNLGKQKTKVYDIETAHSDHSYMTSSFVVHNSAAGSIVAYTLDITKLCPLKYDLLFERFLNPGRRSMPDIDMDFMQARREELMHYARDKYNLLAGCETSVAQIVTFQRYKAKNGLIDSSRVLADVDEPGEDIKGKESLALGRRLSAMIPKDPKATLGSVWNDPQEGAEIRKAHSSGGLAAEVIDQARWLEDMVKTYGIHAAAVIISSHDMTDDLPLQRFGPEEPLHTQYDMGVCEGRGLLKMDFLGLNNLDIILDACEKIKAVHGVELHPWKDIPLDDTKTYELFARGETVGTFQFESSGMRTSLQEVKPTEFADLIALVALYRPGAMVHIPAYARRKNGKEDVIFLDERLEDLQGDTYGITIYQEQSMLIARKLAGFDQAEADDLRKAIGKKLIDKMNAMAPRYMAGCKDNGVSLDAAKALWADNIAAADYSFNKSHAACYALISYITGWLKANYPYEYMAALLTASMGDKDKPRVFLTEAKRMGIQVLPPDINRSFADFAVIEREDEPGHYDILFGMSAIRGVGAAIVEELRTERNRNGFFTSIFDVIRRMPNLKKNVLQALVKGGALDSTGDSRMSMFDIIEEAQKDNKKRMLAEEKAFINAVKARVETAAPTDAPVQESLLDGMDAAFASATGSGTKGKKIKLTTDEKKAIEGGCKSVWAAKLHIDEEVYKTAVLEALKKDALRIARKEARESFTAGVAGISGISSEESSDVSLKDRIEDIAQSALKGQLRELKKTATELSVRYLPFIEAEVDEREQTAHLDAALDAEADPKLPAAEWDRIEMLNIERGMLGVYVTGHPLDEDAEQWRAYVNEGTERGRELGQITSSDIGRTVIIVGAVVGKDGIKMRSGEIMYRVTLEDLSGSRETTIFPRTLEGGLDSLLTDGHVVCMEVGVQEDAFQQSKNEEAAEEGEIDENAERPIKLTASRIYRWDASKITPEFVAKAQAKLAAKREEAARAAAEAQENAEEGSRESDTPAVSETAPQPPAPHVPATPATVTHREPEQAPALASAEPKLVKIAITQDQFNPEWVNKLQAICEAHPGPHPVRLILDGKMYKTKFSISPNKEFAQATRELLHGAPQTPTA